MLFHGCELNVAPYGGICPLNTGARIFQLFHNLNGAILSVVGDVPIDNEAPIVNLS
jgi:hypothetical protein